MRKIVAFSIVVLLAAFTTACDRNANINQSIITPSSFALQDTNNNNDGSSVTETVFPGSFSPTNDNTNNEAGNVLIVYFTHEGNTNFIGRRSDIDAITSASVQRRGNRFPPQFYNGQRMGNTQIIAKYISEYTGGGLFAIQTVNPYPVDAYETLDTAQIERSNNSRPKLFTHVEDMDRYDTIYLGFPIWWGTFPMPVFTFLEEYDFTGKAIIPFSTHDGSGLGNGKRDIQTLCPDAIVLDGLATRYDRVANAEADVKKWLNGLSEKRHN
jgi:flavodoxin